MKVGLKIIRDYCKDLYWTIIEYDDVYRLKPILSQYAEKPCYDGIVLDILEDIMRKQMMHEKAVSHVVNYLDSITIPEKHDCSIDGDKLDKLYTLKISQDPRIKVEMVEELRNDFLR